MSRKVTFRGNNIDADNDMNAENDTAESMRSPGSPYRFDLNLIELIRLIFDRRRLVIGATFAVMVVAAAYLLLQPNRYTSTATILPSGKTDQFSTLKNLVGLGGTFANADENSSMLYPVILKSNLIVDAVLDREYTFTHDSKSMTVTLDRYFGIENRDRLRRALRAITTIRADNQNGEIYLGVETIYPRLSQAILENYLAQLEDYNRHKRRSSARENEQYLAEQLADVERQLRAGEDSLEAFQKANLDWAFTTSPEILKELGRLQRAIETSAATYTVLLREHEMAKLEAQKDTPIIRVLDRPSLPTVKSGPFRRNMILLSGFLTFIMISLFLIIRHLAGQMTGGENRDDFDALRRDWHSTLPRTRRTINRIKSTVREKTPLIKV